MKCWFWWDWSWWVIGIRFNSFAGPTFYLGPFRWHIYNEGKAAENAWADDF